MTNLLDFQKPISELTVKELIFLLREINLVKDSPEPEYIQGMKSLASFLGCSQRQARRIKASGKIDAAIIQTGKTILIDKQRLIELLKKQNV